MKYCKICLQTDTRPNISFNKKGICPNCINIQNLKNVDWTNRLLELKKILKKNKSKDNIYDGILGVSGGKDSLRQAIWLKEKFNLKILLVCVCYPPEQVSEIGVRNISNIINTGFDLEILSLSPKTWKELMKKSFINFSNWAKSTEQALFSVVPRIAINYKIPLIFWGENPGLYVGDKKALSKKGYDGKNLKFLNTLKGGGISWMKKLGFKDNKIFNYKYPSSIEMKKNNIKIVYLSWFWKEWSIRKNGLHSALNGFHLRKDNFKNTQDLYNLCAVDEDWVTLNQMIKYYKYGFGRISDYINEDIRNKKISRNNGIKIIEKFDGKCDKKYIKSFCNYINISEKKFWNIVKRNVNRKLFFVDKKKITRKFKVGIGL